MLNNVQIILIGTTHPGNIGAVARAMKNMCLERLSLVRPKIFPSAEATARASGADDLLAQAQVFDDLDKALDGCRLVVGASARRRSVSWPQVTPGPCAQMLLQEASKGKVALLFGRESSGLSNEELDRCQYLVHIPANPDYSSLNLSQAVQVLSYELRVRDLENNSASEQLELPEVATAEAMERFFEHLRQTMEETGFSNSNQSEKLNRRLRRLFLRARPDDVELNILHGILSAARGRKSMRRS
ncbi:MAG: RNA methyltransferase [Gammaproteobacteria bacterium]|nr:RNA methyltransferase [Gammaproteobacteria bacterium]